MTLRCLRLGAAILLLASGALMYAASWQRWAGSCSTGGTLDPCELRQDHLYDFLPPAEPWAPAGDAAFLAGLSLLVLALALPVLPWALTGRRPGACSAIALLLSEVALVAVALATLRTGLSGVVVDPALETWSVAVWFLGPPLLLARFAFAAHGWARAASVVLALSMPLVGSLTYAIGSYDTQPWWEAVSGSIMALGAFCLLVAATLPHRTTPVVRGADGVPSFP